MYSIKKTAVMITVAATLFAQPMTALAAGPADSIQSGSTSSASSSSSSSAVSADNGETASAVNTGKSNVETNTTPTDSGAANASGSGTGTAVTQAAGTSGSTGTAAAAQTDSIVTASTKVLPKIALDTEKIRPTFTLPGTGAMQQDPVLNLIPLATYYIYDSAGNRLDYAYTHDSSFVLAPGGFKSIMMEHQNVGRLYYRTYTKDAGWGPWANSTQATPDQGTVQAIMVRVKGYIRSMGDVYYRAVLNDGTETDWAQSGQACGTIGTDKYIAALKVAMWRNDVTFPQSTEKPLDNTYTEGIYFNENGAQYQTADGHAYTGWAYDSNSNGYYFADGNHVTGWQTISGYNIYFDENGKVVKDLSGVMGAPGSYQIRINKATRTMYIMAKDKQGSYTIPYKTLMITVGTDTPLGTFHIYEKYRWHFMHTDCYCQYLSRFYQGFLMHSLLYTRPDAHTMDAINYNFMDDAISGGCIRLRAVDCSWIYNNCGNGTQVTIYSDPWDKGPVEKDAIEQAIPRSQDYDPTDPDVTIQQTEAQKAAEKQAIKDAESAAAAGQGEPQ